MQAPAESVRGIIRRLCLCGLAGTLALTGCHPKASGTPHHYWLEVPSPSKEWTAAAETVQGGFMESAYTDTAVYLLHSEQDGSDAPREMLIFHNRGANGSSEKPPMQLQIRWADDEHLEVNYADAMLIQQTVLYDTVVIRLHGPDAFGLTAPVSNSGNPQLSEGNTP